MAPLADAIVDERAMMVEPNSGLSHRLFDTHAALMALAGCASAHNCHSHGSEKLVEVG